MIDDWINVSERRSCSKNDSSSDDRHDMNCNVYAKNERRDYSDTSSDSSIDFDNESSN